MKINPTIKEFLAKHEDITLISLAWSLYWRLYLAVVAMAILFGILVTFLDALFS